MFEVSCCQVKGIGLLVPLLKGVLRVLARLRVRLRLCVWPILMASYLDYVLAKNDAEIYDRKQRCEAENRLCPKPSTKRGSRIYI